MCRSGGVEFARLLEVEVEDAEQLLLDADGKTDTVAKPTFWQW